MAERNRPGGDTDVVVPKTKTEKETKRPPLYKVLLHNDDYTTQEFVDFILISVFNHDPESAHRIMRSQRRRRRKRWRSRARRSSRSS
jgi:ATP-dependent Clp protease adaptor protein ClpS